MTARRRRLLRALLLSSIGHLLCFSAVVGIVGSIVGGALGSVILSELYLLGVPHDRIGTWWRVLMILQGTPLLFIWMCEVQLRFIPWLEAMLSDPPSSSPH